MADFAFTVSFHEMTTVHLLTIFAISEFITSICNKIIFISGFIHFSILYYLQYFQVVLDFDPLRAGVFHIPFLVSELRLVGFLSVAPFKKVIARVNGGCVKCKRPFCKAQWVSEF